MHPKHPGSATPRTQHLAAAASIALFTSLAPAQWSVVSLQPPGMGDSVAFGVDATQQVGAVVVGGRQHAALWSGTAASWVDLNPPGASESMAYAVSAGQQVGYARFDDQERAVLWTGTAASWVDLSPPGSQGSSATAVANGEQAGCAVIGSGTHAFRWSGTAASGVDLHPAGAAYSFANTIGAGHQAGYVELSQTRAALWSGTASSWLDLTPAGATQAQVLGIDGDQQVGTTPVYVYAQGDFDRACLWSGTAASWRSLHPAEAYYSIAWAANAGIQVGIAVIGQRGHASAWGGTVDTWVDLGAFLPPSSDSFARGIAQAGDITYIVGRNFDTTSHTQAVMWIGNGCNPLLSFSSQPSSITYSPGAMAYFSADTNIAAASLQWRHNGVPLTDGPNVAGSTSGTLTITSTQDSDQGTYDCVAVGICNTVTSNPVVLTCNPILISAPPLNVFLRPNAQIAVAAAPDVSYSYQWRRDTVNLTDTPDQLSGTLTPTLTLISGDASLTGQYDVVVTDSCGTTISRVAEVRICFADFNGDGDTGTDSDIEAFFACLSGNCCSTCGSADFNGDGDVGTDADIESFFRVLGGGSC